MSYCEDYPCCGHTPGDPCDGVVPAEPWYCDECGISHMVYPCPGEPERCEDYPEDCPFGGCELCEARVARDYSEM